MDVTAQLTEPVCVLGAHRSGTSVTTKMLESLGIWLGPERELISEHREHDGIVAINDWLLHEAGGTWQSPPRPRDLAAVLEHPPVDIVDEARDILGQLSAVDTWGWKDPRTSLTWLFWRRLVSAPRLIFCIRDPVGVAGSLRRRDKFPLAKGLWLWSCYVRGVLAIHDLPGHLRVVVPMTQLLGRAEEVVTGLCSALDLDASDEMRGRAVEQVNPGRVAHRPADGEPAMAGGHEWELASDVYERLCDERSLVALSGVVPTLDRIDERLRPRFEESWEERAERAVDEILGAVPPGAVVAVVDDAALRLPDRRDGRRLRPFGPPSVGAVGPPADGAQAVVWLDAMIRGDVTHLAVPWVGSWWLDHYDAFATTLAERADEVWRSERVLVFALPSPRGCESM